MKMYGPTATEHSEHKRGTVPAKIHEAKKRRSLTILLFEANGASIAERIQDDVPASVACMAAGVLSIALTLDSKSFPPPHGDGVNHGELGGRSMKTVKQRPKRSYVEDDGQFDALFSFNLRTPSSLATTPSGKRIVALSFAGPQPDALVTFVGAAWKMRRPLTPG
jgi:hypothetical protein